MLPDKVLFIQPNGFGGELSKSEKLTERRRTPIDDKSSYGQLDNYHEITVTKVPHLNMIIKYKISHIYSKCKCQKIN